MSKKALAKTTEMLDRQANRRVMPPPTATHRIKTKYRRQDYKNIDISY
jgi:predicted metalloprotease with PDZ domain